MKTVCFQSARVSAPCRVCGRRPDRTHIAPADQPAMYCEVCCPVCKATNSQQSKVQAERQPDFREEAP
jgi:hypothetical protein